MISMLKARRNHLLFGCIIGVALFLRVFKLEDVPSSLFIDEVWAAYWPYLHQAGLVNLSIYSVTSYFLQGTYFIYGIFGPSVSLTRLPAAVYGTLLVIAVFFLAKELFNLKVGFLSATLMALSPWAVMFSRYQVPSISGVFWLTLAIYLIHKSLKIKYGKKIAFMSLGSLALGLSLNTHAVLRILAPLLLLGYALLYARKFDRSALLKGVAYLAFFLFGAFPLVLDYIGYSRSALIELSATRTIFSHASSVPELLGLIGERFYLHLSPDFLVLTGGFSYAGTQGFQPMISAEGLLKYSTGAVGMLNYYGILIYPAISYLIYKVARKKSTVEERLLLCWIFGYLITSSTAFYDNPNAARNIIGLPALIIAIAVFIDCTYSFINTSYRKKSVHSVFVLGMIMIILLPTIYFAVNYFTVYPSRSAGSFDYGFKEIAQFLTETDNWKRSIILYDLPYGGWQLAFYSPKQPVDPTKFGIISPPFDFATLSPQRAFIQIEHPINFEEGTVEYRARLETGYGGAASLHTQLVRDQNNMFSLAVYAKNSTFNPNGYLLAQKIGGEVYAEERPLNKIVEYGRWFAVRLRINLTTISFYFDEELITTWSRPTTDRYQYLRLSGESSGVSFSDLRLEFSEDINSVNVFEKNDISDWRILSGTWTFEQHILSGESSVILIVPHVSTLQLLRENNVEYKILKTIYRPEGSIAFIVILIGS